MNKPVYLFFFMWVLILPAFSQETELKEDSHCVGYKVFKSMFFSTNPVLGTSCELGIEKINSDDGNISFQISVPIATFESGEADRDEAVLELLKAEEHPNLVFVSTGKNLEAFYPLTDNAGIALEGVLTVAGKEQSVSTEMTVKKIDGKFYGNGLIKTTMSAFEIESPSFLGGIVMSVDDSMEILFNIDLEKIK